jgi:phage-related protein (TIGR01555 family)
LEKHKITQLDRIARYADLIQKQAGKAVRPYRADGYVNMMTRYGTQKDASEQYKFVPEDAVPDELLTMYYEGNGLFAKIIDTPAEEAIKHGFELKDVSDQTVEDFYTEALDELDWEETAMTAIKWARLFGGSLAVMLINDGRGLDEPLDWRHIQSIDDIRVFDRSVIQPDYTTLFNYDPRDPFSTRGSRLGLPEYYQVFSKYGSFTVHDSRCLVFQNGILPENTTNSIYQLWGVPEYIRLHRAIRDAEVAHRSAPKMLDRSVQPIYKMQNLAAELATEEGENKVLRRLQVIDMARGLLNSLVIDAEGEDYDFKTFQFSGINDVVSASCNMLSALSNIPQTILFGQTVGGLSTTDDTSMENYYNYIERIQRRMLKSNLRYLLSIIFQAGLAKGDFAEYGQDVSVEEHNADPETGGNAPAAAPAATKLPQDMSAEELAERAEKGVGNADGADGIINRPKESVGVLVISDGKVLSGTRHNDFGYGLVCGPGGHVEPGETPTQAAFRETEEEFGISPKELIPLGLGPYEPDTGLRPHLYLCTDYDGEPNCLDLEMTGAKFRALEELDDLAASMFQPFADGLKILKTCIDTALFFGDEDGEMHDDLVNSIGKAVNGDPEKEDGGPGSGNFGHTGRVGKIGGSEERSGKSEPYEGETSHGLPAGVYSSKKSEWSRNSGRQLSDDEVKEMVDATADYTRNYKDVVAASAGYKGVYASRGSIMDDEEKAEAEKSAAAIEKMISLSDKYDGKTERAMTMDQGTFDQFAQAAGSGEPFSLGHLSSWTTDDNSLKRVFNSRNSENDPEISNVVLECKSKTGVSIKNMAELDMDEVLYSKDAQFKVTSVDPEYSVGKYNAVKFVLEEVEPEREHKNDSVLFISENPIDKSEKTDTIKYQATIEDGGPGSGNHGHKGRPGQKGGSEHSLGPKEKAKITKRLVGQQTHDGVTIRSVSSHAFDRIGGRKMSVGRIDRMRTEGVPSPGNRPHTRCYDIDGSRMVIDTESGNVMTVMWRGGRKK